MGVIEDSIPQKKRLDTQSNKYILKRCVNGLNMPIKKQRFSD